MFCITPPPHTPVQTCTTRRASADIASHLWVRRYHDFAHVEFDSTGVSVCACDAEESAKAYIGLNHLRVLIAMFVKRLGVRLTNVSAVFSLHDTFPDLQMPCTPPVVVTDRVAASSDRVTTPTFNHFLASWHDLQNVTQLGKKQPLPWSKRVDKLVWRGSVSYGGNVHPVRHAVRRLGLHHRSMFDVEGPYLTLGDQARYRYTVYTPGALNAFAWRLPAQLALGMLVFMPVDRSDSWFSVALKPGVHYVAIRSDLTDLVAKVQWAQAHPTESEAIAMRARAFVLQQYTDKCIRRHFKTTLRSIGDLFPHSHWPCPEECAHTRITRARRRSHLR